MTEIETYCKKLKLGKNLIDNIKKLDIADKFEFISELFRLEVEHRDIARRNFKMKSAGFYTLKYLEDYYFGDIDLPAGLSGEDLKNLHFCSKKDNIIMYGNPGTGKTHLATALGVEAINKDFNVGFYRTSNLVNKLVEAKKNNELVRLLNKLSKLDLLIMDEWGYIPLDKEGAQLLFQVISDCYEIKSVIITTNLEFGKWVNIFYDKEMTAAIIDRLIHHSHLITFTGDSYRVKNSLIGR